MIRSFTVHAGSLVLGVAATGALVLLTSQASQSPRRDTEGRFQLLPANWKLVSAGSPAAGEVGTDGVLLIDSTSGKTWKLFEGMDSDKKYVLRWAEVEGP